MPKIIKVLQSYDDAFGSKYVYYAKPLFRLVAILFLNAGGPPSPDSKRVFDEYESLLTGSDGPTKQALQSEVVSQALAPPKSPPAESAFALSHYWQNSRV